jgi:hypothetical protein
MTHTMALSTVLKWNITAEKLPPRGRRVLGYFGPEAVLLCKYHYPRQIGSWPHKNLWTRDGGENITQPIMWSYFKPPEGVENGTPVPSRTVEHE